MSLLDDAPKGALKIQNAFPKIRELRAWVLHQRVLDVALEFGASLELDDLLSRDGDDLLGLGIATLTLGALRNAKGTETNKLEFAIGVVFEDLGSSLDESIECLFGISLRETRLFRDFVNQLCFVHICLVRLEEIRC